MGVYLSSTHDVAIVRIYKACPKCAPRGSLQIQDAKVAKKSPSGHRCTTLPGYIFATKAYVDNRKAPVKQQYILHVSAQYGELRPTNGGDLLVSLNFNQFRVLSWLRYCTVAQWRSTKLCRMFGRLLGWYTIHRVTVT